MIPHVPPSGLEKVWPFVEMGLNEILRRCPDSWTPRVVKQFLLENRASLFADESGFIVTEVRVDPHSIARVLNVWCMYFRPGFGAERKLELVEQIDRLTDYHLCETSQFISPRSPWARAMRDFYEPHITTYRRKKK